MLLCVACRRPLAFLNRAGGIPNYDEPSDHCLIAARFAFMEHGGAAHGVQGAGPAHRGAPHAATAGAADGSTVVGVEAAGAPTDAVGPGPGPAPTGSTNGLLPTPTPARGAPTQFGQGVVATAMSRAMSAIAVRDSQPMTMTATMATEQEGSGGPALGLARNRRPMHTLSFFK